MQRIALLTIVFLTTSVFSFGQFTHWKFQRHEVSLGLGFSNFLGELGGADEVGTDGLKDLEFTMTRPTIALGYRYKLSPYVATKVNLVWAQLSGNDNTTTEFFRNNRNLHFRSPVVELSAQFEWYPFTERSGHLYRFKGVRGQKSSNWSPYLLGGIGGIWFNPKAQYTDGNWYALRPLGTEGQTAGGSSYKSITAVIPMGIGVKYSLDKQWSIGFEMSGRMTFTDYLDDVSGQYFDEDLIIGANGTDGTMAAYFADPSIGNEGAGLIPQGLPAGQTRGDPSDNDAYMFAIFSIHYKLLKGRFNLPKF
jgi:hypothetical protein